MKAEALTEEPLYSRHRDSDYLGNSNDQDAEFGILASILANCNTSLLHRLHPMDFGQPDTRAVVEEWQMLCLRGDPLNIHSVTRWMKSVDSLARTSEHLPHGPVAWLYALGMKYVTSAHDEYYVSVLHRDRLRKAIFWTAHRAIEKNRVESNRPTETLEWLTGQVDNLLEKTNDLGIYRQPQDH